MVNDSYLNTKNHLEYLINNNPKDYFALANLAKLVFEVEGNFYEVKKMLMICELINPNKCDHLLILGKLTYYEGDIEKSVEYFNRFIKNSSLGEKANNEKEVVQFLGEHHEEELVGRFKPKKQNFEKEFCSVSELAVLSRKIISKPLTLAFGATLKHKVRVLKNDYVDNGKPTIFSATHVFYDDIAAICRAIRKPMYIVSDNDTKEQLRKSIDSLALFLNGVIFFDKTCKFDRKRAVERMEAVLNNGGNLLIFPESTWNFSPNLLVQKIHWGMIDIAKRTDANIVPVAENEINNEYLVSIGANLELTPSKKDDIISLRGHMATLAYEQLVELDESVERRTITDEFWLEYIRTHCGEGNFDLAKEESFVYRDPNQKSLDELIADLYGIEYRSMASGYDTYQQIKNLSMEYSRRVKFQK